MSLLQAIVRRQWAMEPEALRNMLDIIEHPRSAEFIRALEAERGQPLENAHQAEVRDGVAIIGVVGPLVRYGNLLSQVSGATSYQVLAEDLRVALEDPEVRAIILNVNSPGGDVDGCSALSDMIFAARGKKPLIAYTDGMCCSAAYWIASACDRIVAEGTSLVGSIGVISSIVDTTKAQEAEGIRETVVVSSFAPEKRHGYEGATKEAVDALQATVNALGLAFTEKVARHRGVSARTVRTDFGRGGVFVAGYANPAEDDGPTALKAGLIDAVGSFEDLLAEFAVKPADHKFRALRPTKTHHDSASARAGAPQHAEEHGMPTPTAEAIAVDDKNKQPDGPAQSGDHAMHAKTHSMLEEHGEHHGRTHEMLEHIKSKHGEHHAATHDKLDEIHAMCARMHAKMGCEMPGEGGDANGIGGGSDTALSRLSPDLVALTGLDGQAALAKMNLALAAEKHLGALLGKLGAASVDAALGRIDALLDSQKQVSAANKQLLVARVEKAASGPRPVITAAQRDRFIADINAGKASLEQVDAYLAYAQPVLPPSVSEALRHPVIEGGMGGEGLSAAVIDKLRAQGYNEEYIGGLLKSKAENDKRAAEQIAINQRNGFSPTALPR